MKSADNEGIVFYAGDSSFVGMTFNKGLLPDTENNDARFYWVSEKLVTE